MNHKKIQPPYPDKHTRKSILCSLASLNPDFAVFAQHYESLSEIHLSADEKEKLEGDLYRFLSKKPETAPIINDLLENPAPLNFDGKSNWLSTLILVAFLLGSDIKFEQRADGTFEFHYQYTPTEACEIVAIIDSLKSLIPYKGVSKVERKPLKE